VSVRVRKKIQEMLREGSLRSIPMGDKIRLGVPVMAYCGGIFYLSSLSTVPSTFTIVPDKIGHLMLYSGLGFLVALYLQRNHGLKTSVIWGLAATFCLIYGISDEFHQYFVPGRSAEIGDVMADLAGGLVGAVFCTEVLRRNLVPMLNRKR
jgi:VanZ family protein